MAVLEIDQTSDPKASQPSATSQRPDTQSLTARQSPLTVFNYSAMNKHHCLLIFATNLFTPEG